MPLKKILKFNDLKIFTIRKIDLLKSNDVFLNRYVVERPTGLDIRAPAGVR